MQKSDILIIGAGATGLMAAHELAGAGKKVTVLEARDRIGGRIHTLRYELFFKHVELGAEFVHGDLPVTLNLLNEAGISYQPAGGEMWHYKDGQFDTDASPTPHWNELMHSLNELQNDTSIYDFLQHKFPGEKYAELRRSVERYAAGYDTADPKLASAFALRKEWQNEDEGAQHRIGAGYCAITSYLADECKTHGGEIILNSPVKAINWQPGSVKVKTVGGLIYEANKVIIAMPLGVLQANESEQGAIIFDPPIAKHVDALKSMGFGAIIKILLEFDEMFWEDKEAEQLAGKSMVDMGFILSGEPIPTWWTQAPKHSPVLTGWLGGPPAAEKINATEKELIQLALQSVSVIFKRDINWLKKKLVADTAINWTKDPYTRGSYAYDTVDAIASRQILSKPVENTIYFAGEYLYEGTAMGTVEAALSNGKEIAKHITGL